MKPKFPPIKPVTEQQRLNALAEDLAALARMVRHLANANDRSEPVLADCVRGAIPAAANALAVLQAEFPALRLVGQNDGQTVRWSNENYAETAKAAGGVLVIRTEAA